MKKIILLLMLMMVLLPISACYFDETRKDMELVAIRVYDKDNVIIEGEYSNYLIYSPKKINNDIKKTNSAAPVEKYYYVNGKENEKYTVKFYFESQRHKNLESIYFGYDFDDSYYDELLEVSDVSEEDGKYCVTLEIDHLEVDKYIFKTVSWSDGEIKHNFITKGSNTYIRGVVFIVDDNND